jgi:protein-S-isoprenylcysteine O-methyltransferase Ste14
MADFFSIIVLATFALMVFTTIGIIVNIDWLIGNKESFTTVVVVWGLISIWSFVATWKTGIIPLSGKIPPGPLGCVGSCGKRVGWIVMEAFVLPVTLSFYLSGKLPPSASNFVMAPFLIHYAQRALIYPFRLCVRGEQMPVLVVMTSSTFYIMNGALIGVYFGNFGIYPWTWLSDPRFIIGWMFFACGFVLNCTSDSVLIELRRSNPPGKYVVPQGGMFNLVSCPHYLGECLEWLGFAILSWSLVGVVYALWVNLALLAQARSVHKWYKGKFDDYPDARRALIPFIF